MQKAPIVKIIDMSVVDGPGNRAAVFFQGCNLNCMYCHNPETIDPEGRPSTLRELTVNEILDRVAGNLPFIRGLTLSGGECMLFEDFIYDLCREAKRRFGQNFSCMLDSNGSVPFDKVLPVVDGVMLDIKAFDESAHRALTGAPNQNILAQAVRLAQNRKLYEIRTVVLRDSEEPEACIRGIAALLKEKLSTEDLSAIRYKLIKYRPKGVRPEYVKELKVPTESQMQKLAGLALREGFGKVEIV